MLTPKKGTAALALLALTLAAAPGCKGRRGPGDPRASSGAAEQARVPVAVQVARDAAIPPGTAVYGKYCALCHGADATGYAADNAPSLVSKTFLESVTDPFLTRSIREGRPGTAMAGYGRELGGPLDNDDIAALLVFLRTKGPPRRSLPYRRAEGVVSWGEEIYASECVRCHGTREGGGSAVHLSNAGLLESASDDFLRYAITEGRPGTPMPSFKNTLQPAQIDDLVAMLRSWAAPPPRDRAAPTAAELDGPVVINPKGRPPAFTLREGRFVAADQVKKALDARSRIVIIDARASSDWALSRVEGAISAPYYEIGRLDRVPRDGTWVVAYCACPHHASGAVVDELRKRGYTNTAVLDEGILEWQRRGYPLEGSQKPPAAPSAGAAAPRPAPRPAPP